MTPIETCKHIQGRFQILTYNTTNFNDYPLELRPSWSIEYIVLGQFTCPVDMLGEARKTWGLYPG